MGDEVVRLGQSTVTDFVAWAATVPYERVEDVRREIAEHCDDAVVEQLGQELPHAPQLDSAHLDVILAILGESRSEAAIEPLRRFVWNTELFEKPADILPIVGQDGVIACRLGLSSGDPFRARAVEMLCYLNSSAAHEATLAVIREHPEPAVRHAAIDAYLYNHGDSTEAEDQVRRQVSPEDLDWVGIPRRTPQMDGKEFDERLAALHAEAEPPPPPPNRNS
jgi:hypothetical protein